MRGRWRAQVIAAFVVIGSFATACSGGGNPCEVPEEAANPDGVSVGVAFDIGGIGDKSFNDAAKRGFDQAVDEGLISEAKLPRAGRVRLEPRREPARAGRRRLRPGARHRVRFLAGGERECRQLSGPTVRGDRRLCDVPARRMLGHPQPCPANVTDLTFEEQEGSFLVGVAAAMQAQKDDCDTVGFLGGQTGFLIGKFEAGYTNGVAASIRT